jgi:hypothetical protein
MARVVRWLTIPAMLLAILVFASEIARAQRLANGRRASTHRYYRNPVYQEVAQPPPEPSVIEAPVVEAESLPPPDDDTNLELIEPSNPRIDDNAELDHDNRFNLGLGLGLGKGLGFGLGKWCRPRFNFAALRGSLPQPEPMVGASWLSRPLHVDAFSGVIYGGPLIEDSIRRQGDMFSGFRLGWDWTRRLGGEMRFGFAQIGTEDIPTGIELDDADVVYWDLNVLWYPTGDTRVRPFFSIGLGALHVDFVDAANNGHQKELVGVPIAAGIKYRATPWCAVRADITDNLALPYADIESQGNISITVSAEFHFGGARKSYWPWNPTLQSW